ncbi:hypothetical protein QJQ45_025343 [Haematococcus lacustris]|nr:hypothetical protein QJQ45_025343 [Haematococcus lacustris]
MAGIMMGQRLAAAPQKPSRTAATPRPHSVHAEGGKVASGINNEESLGTLPRRPTPSYQAYYPGVEEERDVTHDAYLLAFEAAKPSAMRVPGLQEFAAALWARRRYSTSGDPLHHLFKEYDADNDGKLKAEEIAAAFASHSVSISAEQVKALIATYVIDSETCDTDPDSAPATDTISAQMWLGMACCAAPAGRSGSTAWPYLNCIAGAVPPAAVAPQTAIDTGKGSRKEAAMGCKAFTSSKSCCRVTLQPRRHLHSSLCNRVKAPIRRHASSSQGPEVLDVSYDFVAQNQGLSRSLPLWSGGLSIVALLLNRAISGVHSWFCPIMSIIRDIYPHDDAPAQIAPVVDASSSQSRADVLAIIMSAVLLLTGLQWLSLKPKVVPSVTLEGDEVNWVDREVRLPAAAVEELQWTWSALRACTRCKSLVVLLDGRTIFCAGLLKPGVRPGSAQAGDICSACMKTGQGNYLANLVLYPGRAEFVSFLPENTQGVAVQPIADRGVLIAGIDAVRGLGRLDQAWLASVADKLEVSLEGVKPVKTGVGFGASGKVQA